MKYQRAYFPIKTINLSQGYGILSGTHKHSYALDLSGVQKVFAPFDCVVKKLYVKAGHSYEVWLTSTKKVLCANGHYGKMTMSITHPKKIEKLKVGQEFKQFESLGIDTSEMTGISTGPHVHIELSEGVEAGWDANKIKKYNDYVNVNAVKPQDYLFVVDDGVIKNTKYKGFNYDFIKERDITYRVCNVPSEPLYIRDGNKKIIGNLYNGDEVLKFDNKTKCLVYHYGVLGYTYKKYLKYLGK